jgi:glycosyltransferase involved in cell wall biosynthesis
VVKPGDYAALAEAVLYLKNNPALARELGESGRKYAEDRLSIEEVGRRMKTILQTCFSRRCYDKQRYDNQKKH